MKPRNYRKNVVIEVEWIDIQSDSAWTTEIKAQTAKAPKCKSVGYVINSDKEILRISHTIQVSQDKDRDVTVIPWGCIRKMRKIK